MENSLSRGIPTLRLHECVRAHAAAAAAVAAAAPRRASPRARAVARRVGVSARLRASHFAREPTMKLVVVATLVTVLFGIILFQMWPQRYEKPKAAGHPLAAPGCAELRGRASMKHAQQLKQPLSDPMFAELCSARRLGRARGSCYRLHGNISCLPSFLVVGFTKAGTSAFFQYASQHRLVRVAPLKEPAYLGADVEAAPPPLAAVFGNDADSNTTLWPSHGRKTLQWYIHLFGACPHCERGEATPSYAWRDYSADAAIQAKLLLGAHVRLVMLVREPVRRAVSHYLYFQELRQRFRRTANLSHALRSALREFERCKALLGGWHHSCTYRSGRQDAEVAAAAISRTKPELWRLRAGKAYELLQAGLYSEHIKTWRAHFPAEAILVIDSALLLESPRHAMRRFERHLQLPHHRNYSLSHQHALTGNGGPLPGVVAEKALSELVDAPLRAQLQAFFAPFNRKLRQQTGIGWNYARDRST